MIWTAVQGAFTLINFLVGFALGYVVLLMLRPLVGEAGYDARLWYQIALVGFFVKELVKSSIRVAWEVITPGHHMHAGILAVPLDLKSDLGITLLANLISLTPGTLSLDISDDKDHLFIHAMYIDNSPEEDVQHIKNTFERRIMLALGKPGHVSSIADRAQPQSL
ncbi:MAG: Na+/H+ antiporter subunit E [Longimonas sp.]|uniref:Na+/H+ antiporter subunit E n=1 Tax=Longimonas sp. TaxID=2039626 RepID=UPI00397655E5